MGLHEPETTHTSKRRWVCAPTPTQQRHHHETCEQSFPPVLALHGFLAAGDTYPPWKTLFDTVGEGSFRV